MSLVDLKKALEELDKDFRTIPDADKDFMALQDRLEVLLKKAMALSEAERAPLIPLLQNFQQYLKEHLSDIQRQAAVLQIDLQDRTTHLKAAQAYGKPQR